MICSEVTTLISRGLTNGLDFGKHREDLLLMGLPRLVVLMSSSHPLHLVTLSWKQTSIVVSQGPTVTVTVTVLKCPFHPPLFYGLYASNAQDTSHIRSSGTNPTMCKKFPCA